MAHISRECVMANTANQLKEMAEECRELAAVTKSATVREQLLEIAERFEKLARRRERRNGTRPKAHC